MNESVMWMFGATVLAVCIGTLLMLARVMRVVSAETDSRLGDASAERPMRPSASEGERRQPDVSEMPTLMRELFESNARAHQEYKQQLDAFEQEITAQERRASAQAKTKSSQQEETLRADAERHKRRADEFFAIIESVLAERDQWREMWQSHGRAHLEAQNMLENALTEARTVAKNALVTINKYRAARSESPIQWGIEPGDKPVGSAAKFKELLDRAEAEAPKPVDALALRAAAIDATECGVEQLSST